MTHGTTAPQEVGHTCPYCHLPLTDGVPALRCDQCQAVHHEGCWRDGGGCAVYGCPNSGKGAVPPPPDPSAYVPAPPPPGHGFPWKVLLLTLGALLLVAGAVVAGYLLLHGDKNKDNGKPKATATATAAPSSSPKPKAANQAALAVSIEKIVAFSQAGRAAVQKKKFDDAIANRKTVLSRLKAVHGATGQLAKAKSTLTSAMTASLHADEAYAAGKDPSAFNTQATKLKAQFVTQWQSVAKAHKLKAYQPGDI